MASFTKSSSLGRSSNPNSRSSELSDPMRRSFTGNPFSKPSVIPNSSRTFLPATPANTPTDSQRRNSVGGGREVSFFHDLENKENGKDQILKSSKARSPAAVSSKSAKNFMAPTISAASKVTMSPKKKILAERNEPVPTSAPSTMEAKSPSIRKVTFAEPLYSSDLKSENGLEQKKFVASFVGFPHEEMHVAPASLSSEELSGDIVDMNDPFNPKNDTDESSFGTVAYEPDCVILDPSFKLSPTPTPPLPVSSTFSPLAPLDADPLMPPYDPKTNYLSPRPQFLHYRPKPRMERELGESLMSGSFSDTEVTEDTQSDEGSQKSEEFSSDEVIEEEAGISEPIPAMTSLAEETVEAREVPKPSSFMLKAVVALIFLFSVVALVSVSVTNSPVMDHAVIQHIYKAYESSDLLEVAKAILDRLSEFAKRKFDVSTPNFHTWFTKSLSSISELISSVRGVHNMGHFQYYNLTVLQESNVVNKEPIFGPGKKVIIEIETPEVYPQVLNNEESDAALESSKDYESEFVQQDVGVTSAITNVPEEPEEALEEGGLPTNVIESDQPFLMAEVSEPIHSSEVVVPDDLPRLDEKAADNHSEVFNIGNLAENMVQECDGKIIDEYSDGGQDQQSDIAEIYREAYGDNDIELAETEGVNVDEYSDVVGLEDHGLESDVAETHPEAVGDNNPELAEEEGESTSIDAAIEDSDQRIETADHSPHMVLYLLLCAGTILIAGAAFKWSRKGISRNTRVASTVEPPVYDAKAFHASLPTPKENHTSLDKPSLRNGPTEIDLLEESCPSEMSSIQKNTSYRQKAAKELNEVSSLNKQPKKRRESLVSSSDYSVTPSYGSFTTYDRIKIKNGHGEEETITPVRRSSRVRSKATSPL